MSTNYPDLSKVRRILVMKLRHLGDVLLSTPVFSYLKKRFPEAEIDAYVWKESLPILEGNPAISGFHLYDRKWKSYFIGKKLWKEFFLLHQIRKKKYDLVIHLTEGDRGAIVSWISGAPIRVGLASGKSVKQKIFTHLVKPCPTPRHSVEKDLDFLRRIGLFPEKEERELCFFIPEEVKQSAKNLLSEDSFVLVHAPSRWKFKCLPPQLVGKVIDQLDEKIILTGSPSEREFVEEILLHTEKKVVNLAGKTSLKEMGALMLRAKGVITVDSVALHMASALKVPVVALFGPTSEKNWGPWQHSQGIVVAQKRECRPCLLDGCGGSKRSDCLWTLGSEEILRAFHKVVAFDSSIGAGIEDCSASSLFILNSFETKIIE